MTADRHAQQPGFTYVELLIVVIVLGILAAIVIPQVSSASPEDRRAALGRTLQDVRSQVALYKAQHDGQLPTADGTPAGAWDWDKLLRLTDAKGRPAVDAGASAFGPYLTNVPSNPISALAPDRMCAVVYQPAALSPGDVCDTQAGWVIDGTGHFYALTRIGDRVYDEAGPSDHAER